MSKRKPKVKGHHSVTETNAPEKAEDTNKSVVIVNTQPRLVILRARKGFNDPGYAEGKHLLPGENDCDKAFWDVAKKSEGVKTQLALKHLKDKGEGKAIGITESLKTVPVKDTGKYIKAEKEVPTLIKWRDTDTRTTVKKACDEKILKLINAQDEDTEE